MSANSYRVTVKVRNANLLRAIEAAGFSTGSKFADVVGIKYLTLNGLVNMTIKPVDCDGNLTEPVEKLCVFLNRMPQELFDRDQMGYSLETNQSSFDADLGAMLAISSRTSPPELVAAVASVLDSLPPREAKILRLIYGVDGEEQTRVSIAKGLGITTARVCQIEQRAMRRLQHPSISDVLLDAGGAA